MHVLVYQTDLVSHHTDTLPSWKTLMNRQEPPTTTREGDLRVGVPTASSLRLLNPAGLPCPAPAEPKENADSGTGV